MHRSKHLISDIANFPILPIIHVSVRCYIYVTTKELGIVLVVKQSRSSGQHQLRCGIFPEYVYRPSCSLHTRKYRICAMDVRDKLPYTHVTIMYWFVLTRSIFNYVINKIHKQSHILGGCINSWALSRVPQSPQFFSIYSLSMRTSQVCGKLKVLFKLSLHIFFTLVFYESNL